MQRQLSENQDQKGNLRKSLCERFKEEASAIVIMIGDALGQHVRE